MATVIKIANIIQKHKDRQEVKDYLSTFEEEWTAFVDGELKKTNDTWTKALGGQQPKNSGADDEGDDNSYEVNMEKIMQRFTNFNNLMSSSSAADDEEEEEDKKTGEDFDRIHDESDKNEEDNMFGHLEQAHATLPLIEVEIEEQVPLKQEYVDSEYWKVDYLGMGENLEELMKEMSL
jgi:hypothetical protein